MVRLGLAGDLSKIIVAQGVLLRVADALPVHHRIGVFNANPNLGDGGVHNPFSTGQLRMFPRARRAGFKSSKQN
jgi:hypothetical protein